MTAKEKLYGKKILLLSVQTFNYEKAIADRLRAFGAIVDYYDERPVNSLFAKGIIRLKRSLYRRKIDNYYKRILRETARTQYDYLFVIRGEVVPEFFLKRFKKANSNCEFLFYTWDSFTNHSHPISIIKYFDKKFTFDTEDAKQYDLFFRPLFFLEEYQKIGNRPFSPAKYDLLFIGTAHSDRYRISKSIANWCLLNNLSSFTYYYMHGRMVFLFKRMFDKSFQKFEFKELSFRSLNKEDILELYKASTVILDINHPNQKGLTMRTFEALGAGKKLITTNEEIVKYPFYNEDNILVIDRENPELNLTKAFFTRPFRPLSKDLLFEMSIDGWFHTLFVETKPDFWVEECN